MAKVSLRHVYKTYTDGKGQEVTAVNDVNIEVADREFLVLVGPSGCGKSTTLRMIAGLEEISKGEVLIDDRKVNDVPPKDRDIAMVFQSYALYPHMSVFENMAFGLKLRKMPKEEIKKRVHEAASILGIENYLERKPKQLSGGQRQRVALGRAIVRQPKVFLFDEPLSNLDAKMRVQMRAEISRLHEQLDATMIYVTHDQVEAMTMGDRICVMRDGNIMQTADPLTLYRQPNNVFVASFIGSPPMNLLRGTVQRGDNGLVFTEGNMENSLTIPLRGELARKAEAYVGKPIMFGIRPEHLGDKAQDDMHVPLNFTVDIAEPMGSESLVYMRAGSGSMIARVPGEQIFNHGDHATVNLNLNKAHLFDAETENVIR